MYPETSNNVRVQHSRIIRVCSTGKATGGIGGNVSSATYQGKARPRSKGITCISVGVWRNDLIKEWSHRWAKLPDK